MMLFMDSSRSLISMQTPPRARKRRNLAEELVLVLNERIRQGQLKRGDKLPTESEIMEQQGVSRTVVREAISRLQAAGQVETRHGTRNWLAPAHGRRKTINKLGL